MDLQAWNSPGPKPYLNPQVNTLTAVTVTAANFIGPAITSSAITLTEVGNVPNPNPGDSTLFVDLSGDLKTTDSLGNVTSYLEADGSIPMTGDFDLNNNNLLNVTAIDGVTFTEVVKQAGAIVPGNLASFVSANEIKDSGLVSTEVVEQKGVVVAGNLASFISATEITDSSIVVADVVEQKGAVVVGNLASFVSPQEIQDSGVDPTEVVEQKGVVVAGNLASFVSATEIKDSSVVSTNLVQNTSTAVSGNIAIFSGGTGKLITDSNTSIASLTARALYSLSAPLNSPVNTLLETTIAPTVNGIGTMTLAAGQTVGMIIRINVVGISVPGIGHYNLKLKTQAGTLLTSSNQTNTTNQYSTFVILVQAASLFIMYSMTGTPNLLATPAYDPSIQNSFSITVQWSINTASYTANLITMDASF